jgi:hypothetical protein
MYPGIHYSRRLARRPARIALPGEAVFYNGSSYQDDFDADIEGLWGRKNHMTVDPVDDCVFWYTNQYYASGSKHPLAHPHRLVPLPTCKQGTAARISLHTNGTQEQRRFG